MSKELTKEDLSPSVLQKEFDSGLWHEEIAKKYHCTSKWTIYKLVDKYGLQIERRNKKKEIPKYECKRCGKWFTKLSDDGYCCNCQQSINTASKECFSETPISKIHENIISLRKDGLSYQQIADKLNISKSTVSYHCNKNTKNKNKIRHYRNRSKAIWKYKLSDAISKFRTRKAGKGNVSYCKDWNKKLRTAVSRFRKSLETMPKENYTYKDVVDYFKGTTVTCELTGRIIDLTKDDYNIDHILPISRGGTNELNNMAFCIPEANAAKNNLTNDEFVALCKEVCEHFGYKVIKIEK